MCHVTQIARDPFARATLMRVTLEKQERKECAWCGQPSRFRYFWEGDARPVRSWELRNRGQYCSVGCWRSYCS